MNMMNTPTYIYKELKRRKVKVEIIDEQYGLMRYRHRNKWHRLKGCVTEEVHSVSHFICDTKSLAERFADQLKIPVPASTVYESFNHAQEFMKKHGTIVVKPLDAAHGNGITLNISSKTALKIAINHAKKFSLRPPLLQQMVYGRDVRIMVIGGKYVAAVSRVPAAVIGDGKHTIKELIELENQRPIRSAGRRGRLRIISLEAAREYLRRRVSKIPAEGEKVAVVGMGNTSLGGHAEDYTDRLPTKIYRQAEKFARELGLPVCGVDMILDEDGSYYFLEANASPGFGPHHHPRIGKSHNVTAAFVDMLLK